MMIESVLTLFVFLAYMAFAAKRLMTYVHVLQQDDYDNARLMRWMLEYRVFDKRLSLAILMVGGTWLFLPYWITALLLIAAFGYTAWTEKDPRTASKKKLVMTQRVQRIFFTALVFAAVLGLWWFMVVFPWLWIVTVQLIPATLFMANVVLMPFEAAIQKKLWDEAQAKLQTSNAKIIAITGSFGKTSVKHILGHILKTQAPMLITPGSVNTPMGIVRIIREQLDEHHKFFVVEMGAYGPGSIAKLCRLTPPDMGVITAIGHAHYERFKTLDTVAEAKFELAEAVLGRNGKIIVHDSTLNFAHAQNMRAQNPGGFVVCGGNRENDDLFIAKVTQNAEGLDVELELGGQNYRLQAPLYGLHHGTNMALAFAAAFNLGIPAENIITALKSTPQISHRLEVKKQNDGTTIIDDAFNSNPRGFASALELLGAMGKDGRKILITPGMVELGDAHNEEHRKIGAQAGKICDVVIAVNPFRIRPFINAFKAAENNNEIIEVEKFTDAAAWLDANKKPGDIILIENDLPDLYERIPRI